MVQAISFEKTGGPEVLTWQQVSVDKPGRVRFGSSTPPSGSTQLNLATKSIACWSRVRG